MSKSMIESLHDQARALDPTKLDLRQPLHVITGEAIDVVGFDARYRKPELDPKTEAVVRPGLASAGSKRLPANIGKQITLLVEEVDGAQREYLLAAGMANDQQLARATLVLSELTAVLEFLFDDGVEDDRDAQLARAREANDDTSSILSLASALTDYANLADSYREEVDGLGDFDAAMIDEAKQLATALRGRPAKAKAKADAKAKSAEALEWRNRLATLLTQKVSSVRAAARFVFRRHPAIQREAASAYERRGRAARKRAAAKKEEATAGEPMSAA